MSEPKYIWVLVISDDTSEPLISAWESHEDADAELRAYVEKHWDEVEDDIGPFADRELSEVVDDYFNVMFYRESWNLERVLLNFSTQN